MNDINKRFLTNTDETGRFIVKSIVTNRTYYVEPIGNGRPATKEVEGSYGSKYTGCISEKDSLITEENRFRSIEVLEPGVSPFSIIYKRDLEYASKTSN